MSGIASGLAVHVYSAPGLGTRIEGCLCHGMSYTSAGQLAR